MHIKFYITFIIKNKNIILYYILYLLLERASNVRAFFCILCMDFNYKALRSNMIKEHLLKGILK